MSIIGRKVKKYVLFTCGDCHESYEVDYADLLTLGGIGTIRCPWCNSPMLIYTANIEKTHDVRIDNLSE